MKIKLLKRYIIELINNFPKKLITIIPTFWFLMFILVPFLFVFIISFTVPEPKIPPFSNILEFKQNTLHLFFNLNNYLYIIQHKLVFNAILKSLKVAFFTTILCILLGYPMALALTKYSKISQQVFLILIIIPYWISFLLRTYAWITVLGNSTLNNFLMDHGFPSLPLLYNNFSMYLGMTYCYLPFMVLPLYSTLIKIDPILKDAAEDLGARSWKIFLKITIPLSLPGLFAGSLLVFIPAVGEVVVPQIMGGGTLMIGSVIWEEFFTVNNWGSAASISIVLLVILIIPIIWMQKLQKRRIYF